MFGMNVPSLRVTSVTVLRTNPTGWREQLVSWGTGRIAGEIRTEAQPMMAQGLPAHAVELPHLANTLFGPAVGSEDRFDLGANFWNELRSRREIVQCMREGLMG